MGNISYSKNNERHNTWEVPTDFQWKLIEHITNGFAEERKIGSGGYGVVYKGVHPNGKEVAVKKLHHMPGLDEDQFQNELQILSRIRHPNIVQLIGKSYIEQDRCVEHQGRIVFATMINRAICLEFMPEGSLEKHLSDEQFGLRWHSRYKIIKGICDGLKYLHGERIFHLDLKPSNILLDKDMVPKIADFGLSRLFNGTRQSHTTKNLLCTLGYAPPEFLDKGKITNKFDVFSLGVIIIKVLVGPDGRSIYSDMSTPQDFIDLVQRNWRKMLLTAGWKDASYLDVYCNQVKTCTEIALKCVESNSHKRPSIEDIISLLNETEETIDKLYQQLFVVQPSHLCFPFEPDKLIPCPLHLTNNADHDIAYKIQPNTPDIFIGSLNGIVPARSTQTYVLTMQKQQKPPPNLDTIHILSVVTNSDLGPIDSFDQAEVFHDERRMVKITSLYECASQSTKANLHSEHATKAQSCLTTSTTSSSLAMEDDVREAIIREVTRGLELTAQLEAEVQRTIRELDQAKALATFLQKVSPRVFAVCLSILSSPASALPQPASSSQLPPKMVMPAPALAPPPEPARPCPAALAPPRRSQEDSIPREQRITSSPHFDGYQWRKYGRKRITKTQFPRCYFKCSFHRDRNCRATKQVQQCSNDDPPQYVVMYFNEHTCDTTAWEPAATAENSGMLEDLSGLAPQTGQGARALVDEGGLQEEHERRLLVSSLTSVLHGQHEFQQSSSASSRTTAAIAVNVGHDEQKPPLQAHKRKAPEAADVAELDVMDYDVTSP